MSRTAKKYKSKTNKQLQPKATTTAGKYQTQTAKSLDRNKRP